MTLVLSVAVPFAAAVLLLVASVRGPRALVAIVGTAAPAFTFGICFALAQAFAAGKTELVADVGLWLPLRGAELALRVDPPAVPLMLAVSAVATLIAIAALTETGWLARSFVLLNLVLASVLLVLAAGDLVLLLVGSGAAGACGALAIGGTRRSAGSARDGAAALVMSRAGDACLLVASLAALALFQTLDIQQIGDRLAAIDLAPAAASALLAASLLVAAAAAARLGLLPFTDALPDDHPPASATALAIVASAPGILVLLRLASVLDARATAIVAAVGAATAIVASAASITALRREPSRTSALFGAAAAAFGTGLFAGTLVVIVALFARTAGALAVDGRLRWVRGASTVAALAIASAATGARIGTSAALLVATALATAGAVREARQRQLVSMQGAPVRAVVIAVAFAAAIIVGAGALSGAVSLGAPAENAPGAGALVLALIAVLAGVLAAIAPARPSGRAAVVAGAALRLERVRDATASSFAAAALAAERGSDVVVERTLREVARLATRSSDAVRALGAGTEWAHEALLIAATAAIVAYWIAR